jgi:hypothetical protein
MAPITKALNKVIFDAREKLTNNAKRVSLPLPPLYFLYRTTHPYGSLQPSAMSVMASGAPSAG